MLLKRAEKDVCRQWEDNPLVDLAPNIINSETIKTRNWELRKLTK